MIKVSTFILILVFSLGCISVPNNPNKKDFEGLGVSSDDIEKMANKMGLAMAEVAINLHENRVNVIFDSNNIINESSNYNLDKGQIVDKIKVILNRTPGGLFRFIGKTNTKSLVSDEYKVNIKKKKPTIVNYVLTGRIGSHDTMTQKGTRLRYSTFTFELLDISTSEIIWTDSYEYKKRVNIDKIYR